MDEELTLWKRRARSYQQMHCNALGDRLFDRVNDDQLASKVGYALYNAPTEIDELRKTASYTKAQQHHIKLVCDKIKSLQQPEDGYFYVSYSYIVIRLKNENKSEGVQVLFRIPKKEDNSVRFDKINFIDPKPRCYNTFSDYLKKNKLPRCDMCYPINGIYTETGGSVDIHFGVSPACDTSTAILSGLDISSAVLMVGATGITLLSLATPIATPVVIGATATVFASGSYETARNVYRLHDMNKHGEGLGLKNPDSRSAWLNLAGSVVGMASIGSTAVAKSVVTAENAISRTGVITLRILNISSLTISGIGILNGIVTLVSKHINGTLEMADILQFTSACLFFVNAIVSYQMANRLIDELASSDLTNLFNLRANSPFEFSKDVMSFNNPGSYNILRELVLGATRRLSPELSEDLESCILPLIRLVMMKSVNRIDWFRFSTEAAPIFQKIWNKYERVIKKVIEEIKNVYGIPYWQQIMPGQQSINLDSPQKMCEMIDRVIEFCGIRYHSPEHKNLMAFARAFATAHNRNVSTEEFINRFSFYCDCIIAQFREEREMYENLLDSQSSNKHFDREKFDESYGIQGNKNIFFFIRAVDKVNSPDFLSNINELYDKFPGTKNTSSLIAPQLQTTNSKIYSFCGPLGKKDMTDDFYWKSTVDLTGLNVDKNNSSMKRRNVNGTLVAIRPKEETDNEISNNVEEILIHSCFSETDKCHMGLILVILK